MTTVALDFERPLVELEQKIDELQNLKGHDLVLSREINDLKEKAARLRRKLFADLTPWQVVQVSRHPERPHTLDYLARITEEFTELHGDRLFADDAAVVGGPARFDGRTVMVVGHQKGRNTKENMRRNFGMPRPEGYRKAKRLMEMAGRFGWPILSFIDTKGAYPGKGAEERGQAAAIATNLEVMAGLPVPVLAVVIGEGGSGGALALGVSNRILMMQYATYSVISPEGCASILWKDGAMASRAAASMQLRSEDILRLEVADEVVPEPEGGAHRDHDRAAELVGEAIARHLAELSALSPEQLIDQRYQKFRAMGAYSES